MKEILEKIKAKNPNEPEFIQAVSEVLQSIAPVLERHPEYVEKRIVERMAEPDRIIIFPVEWIDDKGNIRVNKGYRIQWKRKIFGPYKGGLRFHSSVNLSILKFLAFEQTLKNALTGLPMGGAKGGADINPKEMSDDEIMRFCQSYMIKLWRYIGPDTDVPAGDIGVGTREIGYLFGMYTELKNESTGVLTGKGLNWGGSHIRPEATGYGLVYFAQEMLKTKGDSLKGKTCLVSGSGNAAQYTVEKLLCYGAKVLTMSDSNGYIYDPAGINREKLVSVMKLKNVRRGRISEYVEKYPLAFYYYEQGAKPWQEKADCAFPCATENELDEQNALNLVKNGVKLVAEGANMPCTREAIKVFQSQIIGQKENAVLYGPGKAANAGGVAVSGLEMMQNNMRRTWSRDDVDEELLDIMNHIHAECLSAAEEYGQPGNYEAGANIAGFIKVADAMMDQGVV